MKPLISLIDYRKGDERNAMQIEKRLRLIIALFKYLKDEANILFLITHQSKSIKSTIIQTGNGRVTIPAILKRKSAPLMILSIVNKSPSATITIAIRRHKIPIRLAVAKTLNALFFLTSATIFEECLSIKRTAVFVSDRKIFLNGHSWFNFFTE